MNYKETLFFVGKSLTVNLEKKNREEIELILKTTKIDWESVVKLSTGHYVLPTIYCNFKRANLLKYLPSDLLNYMKNITDLNRKRNKQILKQAQGLNRLLLDNNITPIFLKGTANLLAGLYNDIGERMVGDIDFIFSKQDYTRAIILLKNNGYSYVVKTDNIYPQFRHYQRLKIANAIAAIEIHKELLSENYADEFNYIFVKKDNQLLNGFFVLSYANKLCMSIISHQINDNGYYYKTIPLRNAYDVFLLSKKTIASEAINEFDKLSIPLNCFLATCNEVFNNVDSLKYNKSTKTTSYLSIFHSQFSDPKKTKKNHSRVKFFLRLKLRVFFLCKCLYRREYRSYLFKRILEKFW